MSRQGHQKLGEEKKFDEEDPKLISPNGGGGMNFWGGLKKELSPGTAWGGAKGVLSET